MFISGTPWHTSYADRIKDERRSKTKCIYFKNGQCLVNDEKCYGTSFCNTYKSKNSNIENPNLENPKHEYFIQNLNKAIVSHDIKKNNERNELKNRPIKKQKSTNKKKKAKKNITQDDAKIELALKQKREKFNISIIYNSNNKNLYNIINSYLYNECFLFDTKNKNFVLPNSKNFKKSLLDLKYNINKQDLRLLFQQNVSIFDYNISFDLNNFEKILKRYEIKNVPNNLVKQSNTNNDIQKKQEIKNKTILQQNIEKEKYNIHIIYKGDNLKLVMYINSYLYDNCYLFNRGYNNDNLLPKPLTLQQCLIKLHFKIDVKNLAKIFLLNFKIESYNITFDLQKFEKEISLYKIKN